MQTFLPYSDFAETARVLDRQRLGKQRVENLQIMKALLVPGSGWSNHPAVKMWRGHEVHLAEYHLAICHEWVRVRGYKDTCADKMGDLLEENPEWSPFAHRPEWLGDATFHRSHQSNLLRKDAAHYGRAFPAVPDDLPYVWPTP